MALTPEEENLERIIKVIEDKLSRGEPISKELYEEMAAASQVQRSYWQESKKDWKKVGTTLLGSITTMSKGVASYNDAIQATADGTQKFLNKFGSLGKAAGGVLQGASAWAQSALNQAKVLQDSYNEISRAGATGAAGITGMFESLHKFNYTLQEIDEYASLLEQSRSDLAQFGGTVSGGMKKMSEAAEIIRESDVGKELRYMGIDSDSINKSIAAYLKVQSITGRVQMMTSQDLATGAAQYAKQQDLLAKMIGADVKKLEEVHQSALREMQYGANIRELERLAAQPGADPKYAKRLATLQETNKLLSVNTPGIAKGFRDLSTNIPTSEEAKKILRSYPATARMIQKGGASTEEIMESFRREANKSKSGIDAISQVSEGAKYFVDGFENAHLADGPSWKEREAAAAAEQKVTDRQTKDMADIADDQRKTAKNMDKMNFSDIEPVTDKMKGLAEIISTVVGKLSDILGIEVKGAAESGGKIGGPGGISGGSSSGGAPPNQNQQKNLNAIGSAAKEAGFSEPLSRALQANVMKESEGATKSEDIAGWANSKNSRIRTYFTDRVAKYSDDQLNEIKKDPQKFAEILYGKSSGKVGAALGNTEEGDGWKYRGRGFIQLTGRKNYADASKAIFNDDRLVKNPDLANDPAVASKISVWFIQRDKARMAKILGIDPNNMTQEQANLLATSIVAGGDVRNKGTSGAENLSKVTGYEKNLPKYATGGIATGPKSGYQAMLHGTEAIVPLPNGRSIPVSMPNFTETIEHNNEIIASQITVLDKFNNELKRHIDITNKILKQSA